MRFEKETYTQLVVQPGIDYPDIEQALATLNWQPQAAHTEQPPLIPGEPELAAFLREDGGRLSYSFNPVVNLRVLSFAGADSRRASREVAHMLPTLGASDVQRLLSSDDIRQILLGLFAATEIEAFKLLPRIDALQNHEDHRVANAAAHAFRKLAAGLSAQGVRQLAQERQKRPDRSVLFSRSGNAHERRQILRWFLREYDRANTEILKVLRSALEDEDWEARVTSMLVAARLRAVELGPVIRRLCLPKTSRMGPARDVRDSLLALRKAVLAHLADEPVRGCSAPADQPRLLDKDAMWRHLRACVAGDPAVYHDDIFLLVHALTTPIDMEAGQPDRLPPSVVASGRGYQLRRSGLPLCWVPGVPHWLGSSDGGSPLSQPIRLVKPERGYFISRVSISVDLVEWMRHAGGDGMEPLCHGLEKGGYGCSYDEALALSGCLARIEDLPLALPTADQWEMAARGPDGRRHPWGNGYEGPPEELESPWGVKSLFGHTGQWTSTQSDHRHLIIVGHDKQLRCAGRSQDRGDGERHCFRVVAKT